MRAKQTNVSDGRLTSSYWNKYEAHLLGFDHSTSTAVWLTARAMRILPFSGNPANVVAITSSLDVYPTSLCTMSLYSYVVYLRHFKNNYMEEKNADGENICFNTSACAKVLLLLFPTTLFRKLQLHSLHQWRLCKSCLILGNNLAPLTS